jgi:hypothetical protein
MPLARQLADGLHLPAAFAGNGFGVAVWFRVVYVENF